MCLFPVHCVVLGCSKSVGKECYCIIGLDPLLSPLRLGIWKPRSSKHQASENLKDTISRLSASLVPVSVVSRITFRNHPRLSRKSTKMDPPPRLQQQQLPMSHLGAVRRNNNPHFYPDILSPRPLLLSTISSSSSSSSPKEQLKLIHDFVVRSLRRRLWKAFQEDDKENALRAYQATTSEFIQWLQEEEDYRTQIQSEREKETTAAAENQDGKVSTAKALVERIHESLQFFSMFSFAAEAP